MLMALMSTFVTIGILGILLVTPYKMTIGVLQMNNGYVDGGMKVKAAIPLANIFITERELRGGVPITGITTTITVLLLFFRIGLIIFAPESYDIQFWTLLAFIVFFAIMYICNCQLVASILAVNPVLFGTEKLLKIVFFPWGQMFIGNHLATMTEAEYAKESAY